MPKVARSLAAGQTAATTLMAPNQASQQALAQKFPSGDYLSPMTASAR
jgi:hypothetical protein